MRCLSRPVLGLLLACSLLPVRAGAVAIAAGSPEEADVRRALTLLNVVGEEYREGVVDGQVVLPVEYDEALVFLDEAQSRLRGAAPETAAASDARFTALRASITALAPLDQVRSGLDELRAQVSSATGVTEQVFPSAPPSASRGRALFAENCVSCHGERADGRGPDAERLSPRPANFADAAFMERETPFDFFHIVTVGKGTSAMPAWGEVLALQERWDLVSYLWTVQPGAAGLAEGQGVYVSACASCHGPTGAGDGPDAAALSQPVPPLDQPAALARLSNLEIAAAIAGGVRGTAMPGFAGRLSDAQMRAAAQYVRALSLGGDDGTGAVTSSDGEAQRFAGLMRLLADEYQRAVVPGAATHAQELAESDILLGQLLRQAPRVEAALAARDAAAASQLTAQRETLATTVRERQPAKQAALAAAAAARLIEERFPAAAADAPVAAGALAEARRLLDGALAAYRDGNPRAVYLVSDAYFLFDPLEKPLSLKDAEISGRVEGRFGELRGVMSTPGRVAEAGALVAAINADLDAAGILLAAPPQESAYNLAFQSAFIILREGFEVVLVVGALLAFVRKSGHDRMRAPILWGAAAGIVASLLTAYALVQIFHASGATAEALEGFTMLLAAMVLFFVSYWLISKAEAERWQRYIQGKVQSALATGSVFALVSASFLAVYREGVETVLFYQALVGAAAGQIAPLIAGFGVGAVALAIVYVLYARLGRRLPMRQFFLVTGALLYYLAVVFAGKGIAELQAAGWVSTTPVRWVPRIDLFGLYPTVETLAAQGVLLLCVLYALAVTLRGAPTGVALDAAERTGAKL